MNKDADLKNLKKSKIKSMFVANNRLQEILDAIKEIRQSSKNDGYENPPQCIFIAGESGSGKTWFVKFYRKQKGAVPFIRRLFQFADKAVLWTSVYETSSSH